MKDKMLVLTISILAFAMSSIAQVKGTFTDARDGKVYKTVTIGTQTWMAENLAYKTESGCWAYENNTANVQKYGYLYHWDAAKKACLKGWHLPSKEEWQTLQNFLGGNSVAGQKMKYPYDWELNFMGNNSSGLSCLPGGCRDANGTFMERFYSGYWWSSTELGNGKAWCMTLSDESAYSYVLDKDKQYAFSVRLIKD